MRYAGFTGKTRPDRERRLPFTRFLPFPVSLALVLCVSLLSLRCTPSPAIETDGGQRERVKLVVSDDGRGFNPDEVLPDSLGLGIMQERAEAIGAILEIESGPGHGSGTQIKVMWERVG